MSSVNQALETKVRTALSELLNDLQPIIDNRLGGMEPEIITYALQHYAKYLKIDLHRDFERVRKENLTSSPFDDILSDENNG